MHKPNIPRSPEKCVNCSLTPTFSRYWHAHVSICKFLRIFILSWKIKLAGPYYQIILPERRETSQTFRKLRLFSTRDPELLNAWEKKNYTFLNLERTVVRHTPLIYFLKLAWHFLKLLRRVSHCTLIWVGVIFWECNEFSTRKQYMNICRPLNWAFFWCIENYRFRFPMASNMCFHILE